MKHGEPPPAPKPPPILREVLDNPIVKQRIAEYLGGSSPDKTTCFFLGRLNPQNPSRLDHYPPQQLQTLLDESCELGRSLADRESMIVHLDIEYVNFDDPAAAFLHPERTFLLQEPLVKTIEARLLAFGIRYLHLVTGQGHHFVWKIRKNTALAREIAGMGICSDAPDQPTTDPLFSHLALLMELLAHQLKQSAAPISEIPVEITARLVGPGAAGAREMISIDISEYGDPLSSRMIRIPYTIYRKPWVSGLIERLDISRMVPEFFTLPLHEMDVFQLIRLRHRPDAIIDLANRAGVGIPLSETGTRNLLESYQNSELIHFHKHFHAAAGQAHPAITPAFTATLPPCLRHVLANPNDLLLKPSGMQLATRCLLAEGWHPAHIADLVSSIFLDPEHQWGKHWKHYDPRLRAEFYVRLFAGEIDRGVDRGIDFNCVSQQEKQFCWNPRHCSLMPFHNKIYQPRKHNQQPDPLPS